MTVPAPGWLQVIAIRHVDDGFVDAVCLSGCDSTSPEIETYSNDTVLLDGIADTPGGGLSRAAASALGDCQP